MSTSNEWSLWHLTAGGWIQGTKNQDLGNKVERPIPSDTVLTCRYRELMSASFSKLENDVMELWRSPDGDAVKILLAKHGKCPLKF
jgi:hypothetical protein